MQKQFLNFPSRTHDLEGISHRLSNLFVWVWLQWNASIKSESLG